MRRALGPLLLLLALAGCYDFDADVRTCREAGRPCASALPVEPDPGTADGGGGGEPDGGNPPVVERVQCTNDLECQRGSCNAGCCDGACAAVTQVVAGNGFTCARLETGRVRCWGNNDRGQLGLGYVSPAADGGLPFVPVPTDVPGLEGVQELAAGHDFACARLGDGTARCWGSNDDGELGRGPAAPAVSAVPLPVVGLAGVEALAAGGDHACALAAGTLRCWGLNAFAQLGDGTFTSSTTPTPVCGSGTGPTCLAFTGVTALDLGQLHSCALKADGSAWCWGSNHQLQLGPNGPTGGNSPRPVRVPLPAGTPSALDVGWANGCAVVGGHAQCWGNNAAPSSARGLLGRGPLAVDASAEPAPVCRAPTDTGACTALEDVRELALGVHAACARAGDAVHCWGYNAHLGLAHAAAVPDDTSSVALLADAPTPLGEQPLLTSGVQGLAAGFDHFCALRKGGLVCWGSNVRGALGTNDTRESNADPRPQRPIW